ncbi:M20 family metallopeptidase [uncultured Anaerococcus sp.]|uniref:M20 metallopeptidase family protein n=1 Tax=uncultured Anaerococcus sp. TaxID=293428 RepID=UPI0025E4A1D4|nr:amidohydrolase [uncultured Anaerococcus sp.]
MTWDKIIKDKINENKDYIIKTRRYLHENPEVSEKEYQTSAYLKKKCEDLNLLVEDVPESTGFTALLDTGRAGKTLGIRADIDALAIEEDKCNLKEEKVSVSKNPGVSHACGHDSHMTIGLLSAKILKDLEDDLDGKIYFIFESAEETGAGIHAMVDHLKDKGLDAVYGNHQNSALDVGKFKIVKGASHAGCVGIEFDVVGRGGHGSRPDRLVNPLIATSHIVTNLNSAWNNQLDVEKPITLGIGAINGGTSPNVIPDRATVKATLRFYDTDQARDALKVVRNVAELTARAHGCEVEFADYFKIVAEPVFNDEKLADFARDSLESIYKGAIVEAEAGWGSESFYGYGKLCPTIYTYFGVRNEERGIAAGAHTDKFDLDEEGIGYGLGLALKFAVDFLKESK